MGLPTSQTKNLEELDKRFSDSVLKIELSGPEQRRLSIIDVPGLFQSMFYIGIQGNPAPAKATLRSYQVSNGRGQGDYARSD